jgi:hypothetical protein
MEAKGTTMKTNITLLTALLLAPLAVPTLTAAPVAKPAIGGGTRLHHGKGRARPPSGS